MKTLNVPASIVLHNNILVDTIITTIFKLALRPKVASSNILSRNAANVRTSHHANYSKFIPTVFTNLASGIQTPVPAC